MKKKLEGCNFIITAINGRMALQYSKASDFYRNLSKKLKTSVIVDNTVNELYRHKEIGEFGLNCWFLNDVPLKGLSNDEILKLRKLIEDNGGEIRFDPYINWSLFGIHKGLIDFMFTKDYTYVIDYNTQYLIVSAKLPRARRAGENNHHPANVELNDFFTRLNHKDIFPSQTHKNAWECYDIDPIEVKMMLMKAGAKVKFTENIKPYKKVAEPIANIHNAVSIVRSIREMDSTIDRMSLMEIDALKFRINRIEHDKIKEDRKQYGIHYISEHMDVNCDMTGMEVEIRLSNGNIVRGKVSLHENECHTNMTIVLDENLHINFSCAGIQILDTKERWS